MDNISNSELLYELIDSLSDDEFENLLDTLSLNSEEEEEEIIDENRLIKARENLQMRTNKARRAVIEKKISEAAKRNEIKKKISEAAKRNEIKKKISEAAKINKIKKRISEKRNNSVSTVENEKTQQLRAQIIEKLEVSRRKKKIQERIKSIKESK